MAWGRVPMTRSSSAHETTNERRPTPSPAQLSSDLRGSAPAAPGRPGVPINETDFV